MIRLWYQQYILSIPCYYKNPSLTFLIVLSCYRHNNEILSAEVYANGAKFYVGAGGKQFNTINDLILHYKNYPLKTDKGVDILLDQVKYMPA